MTVTHTPLRLASRASLRRAMAASILIIAACRAPTVPRSSTQDATSPTRQGLIDQWIASRAVYDGNPTLTPADAYTRLGAGPDGPNRQRALIRRILAHLSESIDIASVKTIAAARFGADAVAPLDKVPAPGTPAFDQALDQVSERVRLKLASNPLALNLFPTIPLASIKPSQTALLRSITPNPDEASPRPYPRVDDQQWKKTVLRATGCAAPTIQETPIDPSIGLITRVSPLMPPGATPCVHENSRRLAELLNRLSNRFAGDSPVADLTIDTTRARVNDHESLLRVLGGAGFTVEAFTLRTVVNFLAYSIKTPTSVDAFRLATWFSTKVDGREVIVPGEHGELDLIVRRGDQVWAILRWFVGVPNADTQGAVAAWRGWGFQRQTWESIAREQLEIIAPADLVRARPIFDAAALVAKGTQSVWNKYRAPANGYGIYVCGDSLALVLAKIQQLRAGTPDAALMRPLPSGRLTDVFPIVRLRAARSSNDLDALFARHAAMDPLSLSRDLVPDSELFNDTTTMATRVHLAFPNTPATRERLRLLPEQTLLGN